jgi:hypothetical protein
MPLDTGLDQGVTLYQVSGFHQPTGNPVTLTGYATLEEATSAATQLEGEGYFLLDPSVGVAND